VAGPFWLTGAFAAVMILAAGYSASRLVVSRLRGLATEADADGLHAVMGAAMAGMLMPQLSILSRMTWMVVFAAGTAWFGACALRSGSQSRFSWQCRYPVPHLIECVAMLYMLLAVRGAQQGTGMAMPGMGASPSAPQGFPALAVVLALFMLGYIMWTTDQLASLARARTSTQAPTGATQRRALLTVPAGGHAATTAGAPEAPAAAGMPRPGPAARHALLAPGLAAFGKIAMGVTMGYMLILML
jgi:Domain of unknown function (DUF5134)